MKLLLKSHPPGLTFLIHNTDTGMEKMVADLLFENFRLALKFIKMNDTDHIKCKYDSVFKKLGDLDSSDVVEYWMKTKKLAEDVITNFDKLSKNDPSHLHRIKKIVKNCKDLNFFEIVEKLVRVRVRAMDQIADQNVASSSALAEKSFSAKEFYSLF